MRRRLPVCLLALALVLSLAAMPALAAAKPDADSTPEPSAEAVTAAAARDAQKARESDDMQLFATPAPTGSPAPAEQTAEPAPAAGEGEGAAAAVTGPEKDALAPEGDEPEKEAPPVAGEASEDEEAPDAGEEQSGQSEPPEGGKAPEGEEAAGEKRSLKEKLFVPVAVVAVAAVAALAWLTLGKKKRGNDVQQPIVQKTASPETLSGTKTLQPERESILIGNLHNIGKRADQQDSFCLSDVRDTAALMQKGMMAVVADGMGGLEGGAIISQMVTDTFLKRYRTLPAQEPAKFLYDAARAAQSAVRDFRTSKNVKGGSTLVAVILKDDKMHYISIGDSHIYLLRGGRLAQVNKEHNFGALLKEQAARGEVDPEEPYVNPRRAALTSYVGIEDLHLIDRSGDKPLRLQAGDKVILCSDGVFNALGDDALTAVLSAPAPEAAEHLEQAILSQDLPKQDNFTAVLLDWK